MKMTVAEFIEYLKNFPQKFIVGAFSTEMDEFQPIVDCAECQVATEYDEDTGETIKYEKGIYFLHD